MARMENENSVAIPTIKESAPLDRIINTIHTASIDKLPLIDEINHLSDFHYALLMGLLFERTEHGPLENQYDIHTSLSFFADTYQKKRSLYITLRQYDSHHPDRRSTQFRYVRAMLFHRNYSHLATMYEFPLATIRSARGKEFDRIDLSHHIHLEYQGNLKNSTIIIYHKDPQEAEAIKYNFSFLSSNILTRYEYDDIQQGNELIHEVSNKEKILGPLSKLVYCINPYMYNMWTRYPTPEVIIYNKTNTQRGEKKEAYYRYITTSKIDPPFWRYPNTPYS